MTRWRSQVRALYRPFTHPRRPADTSPSPKKAPHIPDARPRRIPKHDYRNTRINPWHAPIVPEKYHLSTQDSALRTNHLPHTVTITKRLLAKLCQRVQVESGTTLDELCKAV